MCVVAIHAAAVSCTTESDRERFDANGTPLRILRTVPETGGVDVPGDVPVELCLSTLVDPASVSETAATISSGSTVIDTELSVQLVPWTIPGGAPVPQGSEAPWCSGSVVSVAPEVTLTAGARFRLRLLPDLVGWAGESLDTTAPGWLEEETDDGAAPRYFVEFDVGEVSGDDDDGGPPGDDPEPDEGPTMADLFADGGPFDPRTTTCACHRDEDDLAFARLDLSTPEAAFDGLVGRAGTQDTGFPMITPRDPSRSFLLHKLLRTPQGEPIEGVRGDAMPKDGTLAYRDLVAIALWIEAGAMP